MLESRRWLFGVAVLLLLAACVLTACTVSISGGIAGIVATLAFVALLLGLGATQSGCDDRAVKPDTFHACLSPPLYDGGLDLGACLKPPPPDGALDLGVCLSPRLPDGGLEIGPCLDVPQPDIGVCLQPPLDMGACLKIAPDAIGPCLSMPLPDASAALPAPLPQGDEAPAFSLEQERATAVARLADRLPADVLQRLASKRDRS